MEVKVPDRRPRGLPEVVSDIVAVRSVSLVEHAQAEVAQAEHLLCLGPRERPRVEDVPDGTDHQVAGVVRVEVESHEAESAAVDDEAFDTRIVGRDGAEDAMDRGPLAADVREFLRDEERRPADHRSPHSRPPTAGVNAAPRRPLGRRVPGGGAAAYRLAVAEAAVTVVLTCLDEADLVTEAVRAIRSALAETPWTSAFIVVDDGSSKQTLEALRALAETEADLRLVEHGANLGRGRSVSDGLERARTPFAGFIDPDLEIPAASVPAALGALEAGADVVVGRRVPLYSLGAPVRSLLRATYAVVARAVVDPPVRDPDAGFKFFRRSALETVLPGLASQGWFWDTEVVVRAARAGLVVREIPVSYRPRSGRRSTVEIVPTIQSYLRGLSILRRT